jgi:hypothetical protein
MDMLVNRRNDDSCFHEALLMGNNMDHLLVNPNQLQHYGVTVQDNSYAPDVQIHLAS